MKKIKFFLVAIVLFVLTTKTNAQVAYRDSAEILIVNDKVYKGDVDSLCRFGEPCPTETWKKKFIMFGNCLATKRNERVFIYTQDSVTKQWCVLVAVRKKTFDTFGPMKSAVKISNEEVYIFYENKTLHVQKNEEKWVIIP